MVQTFTGTPGNDSYTALPGDERIDALGGIDTITFNFKLTDATVSFVGNQVIVDSATSHTVLTGFERYQFTDGLVDNADSNPLIDDLYYYSHYHDVWNAHLDADAHYLQFGWKEGRDPSAFFSTSFYLSANPDVRASGLDPLLQYDQSGWKEGRLPSPSFDGAHYLTANPDVAAAHIDPLLHFLQFGAQEGRQPFAATSVIGVNGFDFVYYMQHNPDVAASGVDLLGHFVAYGAAEGRDPNAFFDMAGYLGTNPDVAAAGINPFTHYALFGWSEGRDPSPLFDSSAYLAANPDVAAAHVNPLEHYLRFGMAEGRAAPMAAMVDADAASNVVLEGADMGTVVGVRASWDNWSGVSYELTSDSSGGGFAVDSITGTVVVSDPDKLDFETSGGSNHQFTITVQATDRTLGSTSQTYTITVANAAPSVPVDSDASDNTVQEGAANGTLVGIVASSFDPNGPVVTYSLSGDTSGGGFTINATTGEVTVADAALINYETASHSYTITAQASDGVLTSSQTFVVDVTDVAPSTPVDTDAAANTVAEGAAAGTVVGVTASSSDVNGPSLTYTVTGDTSGGGFTVDSATGVVTVADPSLIDFESSGVTHTYDVTVQASDGTLTSSQTFTIGVTNAAPTPPTDGDTAPNSVAEGAAVGTTVGVTAVSSDPGNGPAVTYSIATDTSGGGFAVDPTTGIITVADPSLIDFETSVPTHSYDVTVAASDGTLSSVQTFTIGVDDVGPSTPADIDGAANSVMEGATFGTGVGVTAAATDVNGGTLTYTLSDDSSGGGFAVDPNTGVVTVANSSLINFETPGHNYTVTVQASDGTLTSSETFTIDVTNAAPSTPVDTDAAQDAVAEGAAVGTSVGVTASSTDVNGPPVTYSITADTSGGGFTVDATTGVVTVADQTLIDYETSGLTHSYDVTVAASDGTTSTSQTFTIGVTDVAPSVPVDVDTDPNSVAEGAAVGTTVGISASSTDVNGPDVAYSIVGDTSFGGFTINASTGVVTVADPSLINFEASGSYTIVVQSSDGTQTSSQAFVITVTDLPPATPLDIDPGTNQVSNGAPAGSGTGVTASAADPAGGTVTYSLFDDAGGRFVIDVLTGVVTASGTTPIVFNDPDHPDNNYTVTVHAADPSGEFSTQDFVIAVVPNTAPVATDDSVSATEASGLNNAIPGVDPSGNVILGTGAAGNVQDTDAQDASTDLIVVAVHTGAEGASVATGTVGTAFSGVHGSLTLNSDGSYTYAVDQNDTAVQGLHTSADTLTDVFNYTIEDTGGLQDTATLTITIHGADDLPQAVSDTGTMNEESTATQFDVIANDTRDPDSTASNAITIGPAGITVTGPAGETFLNSDAQATIVANKIQVTLTNSHFQQLAVGEHATVTIPYTLTGDVGETSTANLVVTVDGVNDVPVAADDSGSMTEDQVGTFTVLTNDTLDADHGAPNTVSYSPGTLTIVDSPAGEAIDVSDVGVTVNGSNQIVVTLGSDFQHMRDGEVAHIDIPYTLTGDQPGDTSTAVLHLTVNGANDAPTAANFTFNGANSANYNTDLVVNDPVDGAPADSAIHKSISGSILGGATDADGPGPLIVQAGNITTTDGGHVVIQADGDFIYTPKTGTTATTDSFTYTISDQNTGVSGAGTATGTVNISLQGPHIWYVDASAAGGGDGSSEHPFNSLSPLNGVGNNGATTGDVDGANDIIFLANGTYAGGLTLENGQQLISQSNGLVVADGGGVGGTVTLVSASGANAVVQGGVVLASGNNIQGVNFGTTSGFALSGTSVGTVHVNDVTSGVINNASGGGVSIGGTANVLNMDFTSITSGGSTNGIALTNASGTFHAHGGTISGASGADVLLNGGTVNFTLDGAINDATGTTVSISNLTGGTQDFNGAITGGGITLATNTGATMSFDGGMTLSTGTASAFSATGGGTLTVTGTNHLTTTTGTALNITNTTIGAGNATFHDISANGAANGIVLNTTGAVGGVHVTGNATSARDGSGGTITNTTGDGVSLTSTMGVQLTHMNITNAGNNGVFGSAVNGFVSDWNTFTNNGNATHEGAIRFGFETDPSATGLTGGAIGSATETRIDNTSISGSFERGVSIFNNAGTLTQLNVHGTTITGTPTSGSGMLLELRDNAIATTDLQNSTFTANHGFGFQGNATDNSNLTVNAIGAGGHANTFTNNNDGIVLANGGNAHLTTEISGNTFSGNNPGTAITVTTVSSGTSLASLSAKILNNNINVPATGLNDAIQATASGTGSVSHFKIDGNTIVDAGTGANGIFVGTPDSGSSPNFTAIITNNNVTMTDEVNSGNGISAQVTRGTAVFKIEQNTVSGAAIDGIFLFRSATGTGSLERGGSASNTASVVLAANNPNAQSAAGGLDTEVAGTFTVVNNGTITLPLLAASGGVEAASPALAASTGEFNLTQAQLALTVAAAIDHWAAAGASADQISLLQHLSFTVSDMAGASLGGSGAAGQIAIDSDAAGFGWYIDPTPNNNAEFANAASATHLSTNPTENAAGHIDLLTAVMHEMGHQLGLEDTANTVDSGDLMYAFLTTGERRLPDGSDVIHAQQATIAEAALVTEAGLPVDAIAPDGTILVAGTAGNDTLNAGHGGSILAGGGGADTFVFDQAIKVNGPTPPPVTHVADYSAAQGDTIDFSALTAGDHGIKVADTAIVRAQEDASGHYAMLQLNTAAAQGGEHWVNIAQLDEVHPGDQVNVTIDSGAAAHLAQIHVDWLV